MTITYAVEQIRKHDFSVLDGLDLRQAYVVAEKVGADTSLAKRMRGRGFQFDALEEAIKDAILNKATEAASSTRIQ